VRAALLVRRVRAALPVRQALQVPEVAQLPAARAQAAPGELLSGGPGGRRAAGRPEAMEAARTTLPAVRTSPNR
jgi:hypothetical protein